MSVLDDIIKREGFMQIDTGGGCTAYEKVVYVLITTTDGSSVPTSINEPVTMGLYDVETDETVSIHNYDSIVDALKK